MTPFAPHVVVAVAAGGAVGATGRWAAGRLLDGTAAGHGPGSWPWATLVVNLVGCAAIGFIARRVERDSTMWAFVVTGLLGGFTTFSALAVELNDMADAGRMPLAVLYGAVTLVGGIAATWIAELGRRRR